MLKGNQGGQGQQPNVPPETNSQATMNSAPLPAMTPEEVKFLIFLNSFIGHVVYTVHYSI